jgi:RNA polymerase primary sigma factor
MINHQNIELEQEEDLVLDPESDDSEASDILELIERESSATQEPEVLSEPVPAAAKAPAEDLALESLYFRSFGERPLLKREEEIALAKRIDQGTRAIRAVLRETLKLAVKMRKDEVIVDAIQQLNEVRQLSGFSATALDNTERLLATLISAARQHRAGGYREKQYERSLRQLREARVVLERAKDEMVRCNLRLVVDIAKHYNGKGLGLLDLIQEGNIGLMKAAERYQYRKGFKFSTYATWWVRQGITRALADQSRTIRIPVHMTESSHRIVRTTRRLAQQFGREPKAEEIGRSLQIHPDKIKDTLQIFQEPVSLDNPVGDGETLFGELIADRHAMPPDSHVNRTELTRELDRILSTLTPREQVVIRMRFGIGQDEPFTLEQVGQNLSVTRERIRQIEAKALKKLKTPEIKQMFAAIKD